MENILDELTTAYQLTKAKPTAWELHELHIKGTLRRYLIEELRTKPGKEVVIKIDGAQNVTDDDFLNILLMLVNNKRRAERKSPLAINY